MVAWLATILLGAAMLAPPPQRTNYAATSLQEPMHHASGTFEVKIEPLTPAPAEGLTRMSIDKQVHGGLEATTKGEMISGGDPKAGAAGYVAMELVTGKLDGLTGSFALQHTATMQPAAGSSDQRMQIIVVPGSGTGELKGLAGTFNIHIANGQHSYTFDYTLPKATP